MKKKVHGVTGGDDDDDDDDLLLPVRNSVVFLYRPEEEKSAGPMLEFVSADRPTIFEEITSGGYLKVRMVIFMRDEIIGCLNGRGKRIIVSWSFWIVRWNDWVLMLQ